MADRCYHCWVARYLTTGADVHFQSLIFLNQKLRHCGKKTLGTGPSDSSLTILRDTRFTLIEFAAELSPILYDLEGRDEMENVTDRPEFQNDLNRLRRLMLRHRMKKVDHTLSRNTIAADGPRQQRRHKYRVISKTCQSSGKVGSGTFLYPIDA